MPLPRRTAAPRFAVLLAVLLAHTLLWWGARQLGVWRERGAPVPVAVPLVVRVVPAPAPAPADDRPALPPPLRPASPALPPSLPAPLAVPPTAGQAPVLQWIAPPAEAPPTGGAPPANAPVSPPLVLDLPRGASAPRRSPALDDPRANSRPRTLESRIAEATGGDVDTGGRWTEEALAGGLMRVRRGRECWIVAPSRDGQLDPFNQSAVPKLRSARAC